MKKRMLRRWFLWLHGWAGVTVGAWLAAAGLTGSLLVWRAELEPFTTPIARVQPAPGASGPMLQTVYERVTRLHPGYEVERIYPSPRPGLAHEVRLKGGEGLIVYIDPANGDEVGSHAQHADFFGWLDYLHVHLMAGEVGHILVGIAGGFLVLLSLSGIWLWWPRRGQWGRAFAPRLKTNWRGRNYELHRVTGALIAALLLMEAATGMAMVWTEPTRALLGKAMGQQSERETPGATQGQSVSLDQLAATAQAQFPGAAIARLTFPRKEGAALAVRLVQAGELNPNGNTFVWLDPVTGRVLKVEDPHQAGAVERWMNLRYPLHTGTWAGIPGKILQTVLGLLLAGLYVSGLLIWAKRHKVT